MGFEQGTLLEHKETKTMLKQKYICRLNSILKTNLTAGNKAKAINTYAVPILSYSFGIINWTHTELTDLQRTTRTILTRHRHHPKSAIERLLLPRIEGGRNLANIHNLCYGQIETLRNFFH